MLIYPLQKYAHLPFTKIFDITTLNVNEIERDFLLKTNVDYTICDKKDKPLMCIEFDGMGHGFCKTIKNWLYKSKLKIIKFLYYFLFNLFSNHFYF